MRSHPAKTALNLWPSRQTLSFRDLDELARHWSEALRAESLRPGDRVLMRCGNTPAFLAVFLACSRFRLTMIPLEAKTTREQTQALADTLDARILVTARGCVRLAPTTGRLFSPPSETALLKLTSGSTGAPRAVAHSEATLAADCKNICETMGIRPDDVNLAVLSLAHSYGFSNLVLPLVTQGTAMTLLEEFVPRAALEALERTNVTVFPAVPFMWDCLNQISSLCPLFPHLRLCISAGAPLPPDVAKKFYDRFGVKIHSFYGTSECGGITYDSSEDLDALGEHVGTPINNVKVDLTVEGRVRVASDAVGLSYWPNANQEERLALQNGVFLTGDLGRFDQKGRLCLVGRVTQVINVAGKKVNAGDIERCIRTLEGVKQAVVLGAPDQSRGEQIVAFVVAQTRMSAGTVLAHCRKTLADHQLPRRIKFLKQLPLSERGKLARDKLLKLLD